MKKTKTERARRGEFGEFAVCLHYLFRFHKIRAKNYRIGHHELDVIAENRKTLVFVEVKTRTVDENGDLFFGSPAASVTSEKQKNLISAARAYLFRYPTDKEVRFDVAEVYLSRRGIIRKIHIIPDAFRA